ncbi:hypothetical protein SCHPADRAFT_903117 [Schizopora paradoxa]|uniref:Uncharacterized protein n=1 Tax=Schizopora paradoxa TaxID=27342 RepID=A0A0H2RSJ7_9AGAM|nr:hypothetical protein SCHPADRAFT_903117 [Schizopora paradoxa]
MPPLKDDKPLSLSDTLRDLAVLRASDIDLAALLKSVPGVAQNADLTVRPSKSDNAEREEVLDKSYAFVSEAKAAMKIMNSGSVDDQGARIENVRTGLEEVLKGLDSGEGPRAKYLG